MMVLDPVRISAGRTVASDEAWAVPWSPATPSAGGPRRFLPRITSIRRYRRCRGRLLIRAVAVRGPITTRASARPVLLERRTSSEGGERAASP